MAANKVIKNAYIYTADAQRTIAEAVALENGKIVYVGTNGGAATYIDDATEVVDAGGHMIMPSFFEGHAHFTMGISATVGINLAGYNTTEEYVNACRAYLNEHPGLTALRGQGYLEACFPGVGPNRADLDLVSTEIPIVLQAETLHSLWANTAAIKLAGVTADTPDPANGKIEHGEAGEPSGCFRESAQDLILNALPDFTVEQYKEGLLAYQDMCHSLGFTGSYDPWLYIKSNAVQAIKELGEEGKLSMYLHGAYWANPHHGAEQVEELVNERIIGDKDSLVQINAAKLFMDGVLESQTAFLREPYELAAGRPEGWRGDQIWDPDNMNAVVAAIDKAGMGIHVHCAGDAAVKQTLDAIAFARDENGARDARHCITHIFLLDPDDIPRFKDLDVVAMTNSYWFQIDETTVVNGTYTGAERIAHTFPEQCLFAGGVRVANASDYPITAIPNPFVGIELGVTRIAPDNYHPWIFDYDDPKFHEPLWPEERANVLDMIDSFTINQAYANFIDDRSGSIEAGKDADFIIIDRNIIEGDPEDIGIATVLETIFQGKTVYAK